MMRAFQFLVPPWVIHSVSQVLTRICSSLQSAGKLQTSTRAFMLCNSVGSPCAAPLVRKCILHEDKGVLH